MSFDKTKLPTALRILYNCSFANESRRQIEDLWLIAEKFHELYHTEGILDDFDGLCIECGNRLLKNNEHKNCETGEAIQAMKRLIYNEQ